MLCGVVVVRHAGDGVLGLRVGFSALIWCRGIVSFFKGGKERGKNKMRERKKSIKKGKTGKERKRNKKNNLNKGK